MPPRTITTFVMLLPAPPFVAVCILLLLLAAPATSWSESSGAAPKPPAASLSQPRNTVLWISVDGLRSDYLDRAETPFFDQLRQKGASSMKVAPVFPSVTFASHVSQATGVRPEQHGITGNSFYDNKTQRIHRYPGASRLLEAEPIWITASRQGIRSAVLDWPLAHAQEGPVRSAYSGQQFDRDLGDEERLNRLLDLWEKDNHKQPLQLILGYITSPDVEGHRYGPDAPEVTAAVERVDAILAGAFDRATRIWRKQRSSPDDRLFLVITSDHGMSQVTNLIHPGNLTGLEGRKGVLIITTGNVGHVHLDQITDGKERRAVIDQTLARLSEFDYVHAFPRDQIPMDWGLRHPTRTGDLLLVLDTGYTFSRRVPGIEQSVEEAGGPFGMHGYDPAGNPGMLTPLFIFRTPDPVGEEISGPVDALRLHATICRILGINPAPEAMPEEILWQPAAAR